MSRDQPDGFRTDVPGTGNYQHAHRAFLQAFLSRSVMTVDEMKPVVAAIMTAHEPGRQRLEGDITQQMITSMIQTVNAKITALDYEIRSTRDQADKTLIYALVNTTSDGLTQLATTFTVDEIAYVKRLLDAMFDENNTRIREVMAVKEMKAIQLAKAPSRSRQSQATATEIESTSIEAHAKSISQSDADNVLSQLTAQGFLRLSPRRYYSLAPRALMELRTYLKETYNDPPADGYDDEDEDIEATIRIRDCDGCREIVTVGVRCSDKRCGVRFHDGCANQYFRGQHGDTLKCPNCKKEWNGSSYVGERADRTQPRKSVNQRSSDAMVSDPSGDEEY